MKKKPTYDSLAYDVLKKRGKPLNVADIIREIKKSPHADILKGSVNPQKTLVGVISLDIKKKRNNPRFFHTAPNTYMVNPSYREAPPPVCEGISTKRKGEIAEMRVAELISLYSGKRQLVCYRPIADDEGIDLVVKERNADRVMYLQVKSRFDKGNKPFTQSVKEESLRGKKLAVVFCLFDTSEGDIGNLWFVPAADLLKHGREKGRPDGRVLFSAGKQKRESNMWDEYLIARMDLAKRIVKYMDDNESTAPKGRRVVA